MSASINFMTTHMRNHYVIFNSFCIGLFLITTKIKAFAPWEQITIWWEGGYSPLLLLGHPHFYRFLITYPGLLLEDILPNFGFSFYSLIQILVFIILWRNLSIKLAKHPPKIFHWLLILLAFAFMSGRGVSAWLGWIISIFVSHEAIFNKKFNYFVWLIPIIFAMLFSSVSTGVFVVASVVLFFSLFYRLINSTQKIDFSNYIFMPLMIYPIYLIGDYFLLAIQKNINFFGGGISGLWNMLQHGLGFLFTDLSITNLLILLFSILIFLLYLSLGKFKLDFVSLIKVAPILGGFFGFTTLTLVLPVLFLSHKILARKNLQSSS